MAGLSSAESHKWKAHGKIFAFAYLKRSFECSNRHAFVGKMRNFIQGEQK
ncbi:hypothetical protein ACFSE1_12455 [Rhizobium helianthi]|uniref:Uncharacterized protein n=1 Tax=Rhizobium helianthi TaxID=1132695 RepID=A0ABW4M546_9HYPH